MHKTALQNGERFFKTYLTEGGSLTVLDIGAQDVNGSLRQFCPPHANYVGVDFVQGPGVDVVLTDPYKLPFEDNSADAIVSSSCFEHSEMFWLLFLEVMRVLKPTGLLYLNAPSNGNFHRFPVDCWRFYPDSANALVTWGKRSGLNCVAVESYTSNQRKNTFNDYVAIFLKEERFITKYPSRITQSYSDFTNGLVYPSSELLNAEKKAEDQRLLGWRVHSFVRRVLHTFM
ncbi:MAG: class I SAM-dependent methyltransferase [Rhodoferax sp.]|jgi:SAM-dependent methyltransferase|nr:class I SAM-dependent methyltransferase [Rhodoferax sp.]MBP7573757.1 class I SAM-dependent methyltransferase [Rhodoferax sp.]